MLIRLLKFILRVLNREGIIIHHSVENNGVDSVDDWHKSRWSNFRSFFGFWVGYHYYIDRTGRIYHCRRDDEAGAHTIGHNKKIGICLMGNGEEKDFTFEQYRSLERLIKQKLKDSYLTWEDVYGHRDFTNTICPSERLYNWLTLQKKMNSIK